MKIIDRVAPIAEALSLASLGAVLLWLAMSGRYASFVPPSAWIGIIASSVGFFACSLALSARFDAGEHEHADRSSSYRASTRALVAFLVAALLALPFRVSPSELAAGALGARPTGSGSTLNAHTDGEAEDSSGAGTDSATDDGSGGAGRASSLPTLELTTDNFFAQVEEMIANGRAHEGQRVELTGFVLTPEAASAQASIPRVTEEESFAVARMAIWCCAADAYPVGFAVRWDGPAPEGDSWVRVTGTLRVRGSKALVIEADSVTVTSAPNPEFVVQSR